MEGEAYLLRVYSDTSTTGYYSPLHDGCPVLLPVPEPRIARPPPWLDPWRVAEPCTGRPLAHYMPLGAEWVLHRDPRLDLGFYTEPHGRRGRLPSRLAPGWIIAFAAGLAEYPDGFWDKRRRAAEIRRAYMKARRRGKAQTYLIAVLHVHEVMVIEDWSRAPEPLQESPHRLLQEPTLAVTGKTWTPTRPIPLRDLQSTIIAGAVRRLSRGNYRKGTLGTPSQLAKALRSLGEDPPWG